MSADSRSSWHDGAVRERASFASRLSACWSSDEPRDHARRPRAAEDVEVVRNHAEPDPALHSTHAAIATPRQTVQSVMTWFSASWIFTSLPNSVSLLALPLRIASVCGSTRLRTLSG